MGKKNSNSHLKDYAEGLGGALEDKRAGCASMKRYIWIPGTHAKTGVSHSHLIT